jgi:RimJ/RimL family protein N-acetyltransferase
MPAFPELAEPLSDGSVVVRLGAERDIPEILIAYQDDPQLHRRLDEEHPPSGAELGRRSERAEADRALGRGVTLTILEPGENVCRGQIDVLHVDWDNARLDLRIWLAPASRGRGLGQRALRLAARWLLRECGFQRIQILTAPDNAALLGAARAAGFTYEGLLRGYMRGRGARRDIAALSLVRRDVAG